MTPLRNARALAGFLTHVAPSLWRRVAEDRKRPVLPAPRIPEIQAWPQDGLQIAWIGHSTVLIRIDGFNILTDPVFSARIGIKLGPFVVGIKRLVKPALIPFQLPVPDLVLLSHAHMDHLDRPSMRKLENRSTAVITAASTSDLLRVNRYRAVHELRWGDARRVGPATIRAFEVKHWGARRPMDIHR